MEVNSYNSQKILEYIGEGLLYADNEGKILFINKAAENLTGWNRDECIGKKLSMFSVLKTYLLKVI